jgi:hypothetical protein
VSRAPAERPGQSKTDAVQTRRPKSPLGDDIAARTRFVGVGADGLVLHALRAAVGNASCVQCGRRPALVGAAPHRLAGARGCPERAFSAGERRGVGVEVQVALEGEAERAAQLTQFAHADEA